MYWNKMGNPPLQACSLSPAQPPQTSAYNMACSAALPCFAVLGFVTPFNQLEKIYLRLTRLEDVPALFDPSVSSHFSALYWLFCFCQLCVSSQGHPRRNQHFSRESLCCPVPLEGNIAFISSARQTEITSVAFLFLTSHNHSFKQPPHKLNFGEQKVNFEKHKLLQAKSVTIVWRGRRAVHDHATVPYLFRRCMVAQSRYEGRKTRACLR